MVVKREFHVPPDFRFTEEQHDALLRELSELENRADEFLRLAQHTTRSFLAERKRLQDTPVPSLKNLRKSLTEFDQLAEKLSDKIEARDPFGDESELGLGLRWLRQPPDFLEDLQSRLHALRQASQAALDRLPPPTVGPPLKEHDTLFIAGIALDYEFMFGQLPPTARSGWFCGFIDALFSNIPGEDEGGATEHYRLVASAVEQVRLMREATWPPAQDQPKQSPE